MWNIELVLKTAMHTINFVDQLNYEIISDFFHSLKRASFLKQYSLKSSQS